MSLLHALATLAGWTQCGHCRAWTRRPAAHMWLDHGDLA